MNKEEAVFGILLGVMITFLLSYFIQDYADNFPELFGYLALNIGTVLTTRYLVRARGESNE